MLKPTLTVHDADSFVEFSRWHLASGDVDPVYPVLAACADLLGIDDENRARLVLLYVTYYDLGSALTVWVEHGWPTGPLPHDVARLPTGTERRGLRGGVKLNRHLVDLNGHIDGAGSVLAWLHSGLPDDPLAAWATLRARLATPWGNGRWATYKTAELAQKVLGWNVEPTDAGHDYSTGPRQGLAVLYGDAPAGQDAATIALLDRRTETLRDRLNDAGVPSDIAEVETHLCDWHAAADGRYYVGHDIDLMLDQINRPHVSGDTRELVLAARLNAFDDRWLGETNGWAGVRPRLKRLWVDDGEVIWW